MRLKPQDKIVDQSRDYGMKKTHDLDKLLFRYNDFFLKPIVGKITKDSALIADYGGGNGILAAHLLGLLKMHQLRNVTVDIIDIDKSKFIKKPGINNILADITRFDKKNYYDFAISRHTIHFFNEKQCLAFLKKVYANLKPGGYFLLVNWVIDDHGLFKIKRQILDIIEKEKHISQRHIPRTDDVLKSCKSAGFDIEKIIRLHYSISVDDFYKNRFLLTQKQVEKIIGMIKMRSHREEMVGILMKKQE